MTSTSPPTDRLAPWSFAEFVDANGHEMVTRPPVIDGVVGPTIVRDGARHCACMRNAAST